MEQEAHPTGVQVVVVVVVRIDQPARVDGGAETSHGDVESRSPPTCEGAADHHDNVLGGVNVNGDTATSQETPASHHADDGAGSENLCIVCNQPSVWVAIGRCGHRAVCRWCTVRLRFFHRDKRCRVCRTRCPTVVVANGGASADILSTLPLFALREGRVGRFWYHRLTAAYYEDEQEYQAARAACQGILSPFFQPWYWFLLLSGYAIWNGVFIGWGYANDTKHRSGKVRAYALSISCAALVAMIVWSGVKCFTQDPLDIEDSRRAENQ